MNTQTDAPLFPAKRGMNTQTEAPSLATMETQTEEPPSPMPSTSRGTPHATGNEEAKMPHKIVLPSLFFVDREKDLHRVRTRVSKPKRENEPKKPLTPLATASAVRGDPNMPDLSDEVEAPGTPTLSDAMDPPSNKRGVQEGFKENNRVKSYKSNDYIPPNPPSVPPPTPPTPKRAGLRKVWPMKYEKVDLPKPAAIHPDLFPPSASESILKRKAPEEFREPKRHKAFHDPLPSPGKRTYPEGGFKKVSKAKEGKMEPSSVSELRRFYEGQQT